MSQENVELLRRAYEAFNGRDLDAMLALAHDEVVVESRLVAIEGGYRGHEGVRRWWTNMVDVLPDYKIEVEEVRDLGDVTLARLRAHAHGADSAAPLEETVWQTVKWQDGKYIWWRTFQREAEALEAAGLSENAERGYRAIDAMNHRDLDAFLRLMDDDVEAISRIVAVEGGLHGHDGVRRWWENWFSVFPDYRIEVVELRDLGDVILTALRAVGHGAGSDLPFEDAVWNVSRWRKGRCVWWRVVDTREEALEAAGLRE